MEGEEAENRKQSSYTYWVREATKEAAPLPVPRKLSVEDLSKQAQSAPLGSLWNQEGSLGLRDLLYLIRKVAGTWEERNLNSWAINRIKELLNSLDSLEFAGGKAKVVEVSSCHGDASLVTVRNKKRVGYSYEIAMKFEGEWLIGEDLRDIKGTLNVPEASFGDLEDIQLDIALNEDKEIAESERSKIIKDLKSFLPPIRDKLLKFEEELKDR